MKIDFSIYRLNWLSNDDDVQTNERALEYTRVCGRTILHSMQFLETVFQWNSKQLQSVTANNAVPLNGKASQKFISSFFFFFFLTHQYILELWFVKHTCKSIKPLLINCFIWLFIYYYIVEYNPFMCFITQSVYEVLLMMYVQAKLASTLKVWQ